MAYFSADWLALAKDNYAEAMSTRLSLRLNDGTGGVPDTLLEVTDDGYQTLACNPIVMVREKEYGVVQAQAWQIRVSNDDLGLLDYDLYHCWAVLEAGFETADEWAVIAQGRVARVENDTNATVMLDVHSPLVDILKHKLRRDMYFQADGWAGNIHTMSKDDDSDDYNNDWDGDVIDEGVTVHTEANCRDETFVIEFTAATTYKVIKEDDTEQTGLSTGSNQDITSSISSATCVTIDAQGWDGTYTSGDKFVFYTSEGRSTAELRPIGMVRHLITEVAAATAYNVISGAEYTDVEYDTDNWDDAESSSLNTVVSIEGFWPKDTPIIALIQDALKLVHASIYPTWTGQIGVWMLTPGTAVAVNLNGNPGAQVDITDAVSSYDMAAVANRVEVQYLTKDGGDAVASAVDDDTTLQEDIDVVITTSWRVDENVGDSMASTYLSRFGTPPQIHSIDTTLSGVCAEIGEGITINDADLGLSVMRVDVSEIEINPINNTARITAYADAVVSTDYALCDNGDNWDGSAVIW